MYVRRRRKKNPNLQRLGDVLEKALKKNKIALPSRDFRLREAWVQSVGPVISAQTSLDSFKYNVLYVKASNSVWLQQLQFMKGEIMDKINQVLGKEVVKNIFFSIGRIPVQASKDEPAPSLETIHPCLGEKDLRTIEQCTAGISDPELIEILKRVMTKDLKRRRQSGG